MNAPLPLIALRPASNRLRLRAFDAADIPGVQRLLARHGHASRSAAGLRWALLDNPSRVLLGVDAGWVLENGAGIVGFLGNLPVQFLEGGQVTWGASCTNLVVDEDVRAHGIRLLRAFATQTGAGFLAAAPEMPELVCVYESLTFQRAASSPSQQRLRWTVGRGSLLSRLSLEVTSSPIALVPRWARRLAGADAPELLTLGSSGLQVHKLTADELAGICPGHWPQTWNAWATRFWSRPGLWPERSAYHLSWRLSDPDRVGHLGLWAAHDDAGTMLGMAMARTLPLPPGAVTERPSAALIDWAVLPQAAAAASGLLLEAVLGWARSQGAATLCADAVSDEATSQLQALGPKRQEPAGQPCLILDKRPSPYGETAPQDRARLLATVATHCNASWFQSGLSEPSESAPTWHPARATRPASPAVDPQALDLTSSASASQ